MTRTSPTRIDVAAVLAAALPKELVDALLDAYRTIESNFINRKWKASELDAGHFVEAARRIIEHKVFGKYTPIGTTLPKFHEGVLAGYLKATTGDESYRKLIPRVLWGVNEIRNNRGVGHVGLISPNEMDSTVVLYNVKWVLAEMLRLESGLSPAETQKAIDLVVERQTALLWKESDIVRISHTGLGAREQVLLFLYDSSPQTEEDLREKCEYKNPSNFRKILKRLHNDKLIFRSEDSNCLLMPKGVQAAEKIALDAEM